MSYGIKVFNSSGGTVFDSTHSLGRVIGRINTGTTNGSYTYNGTVDGTFFAALMGATTGSPSLSTSGIRRKYFACKKWESCDDPLFFSIL